MIGKMKFGCGFWIFLVATFTLVSVCAGAQDQDLRGVWTFQSAQASIRMDLKSDNTFEWNLNNQDQQQYFNGSWSYANGYLRFVPVQTNVPEEYPVTWNGRDNVTITFYGNPVQMQRISKPPVRNTNTGQGNQSSGTTGDLTGRWVFRADGTEMVFLLMADKSFDLKIDQPDQNQHFTGSYSLLNGQIHLQTDGVPGEEVYPLTFNSDDSWTGVFNGNSVTFTREGSLPRTQAVKVEPVDDPKPEEKPIDVQPDQPEVDNDPEPEPEGRTSVFPRIRPRRPGDAVGNTSGSSGDRPKPNQSGGFLSGGGPAVSRNLAGAWVSSGQSDQITMELFEDGTFNYEASMEGSAIRLQGRFTSENNRLTFNTNDGQNFNLPYEMRDADTITIHADETTYTMHRRQQSGQRLTGDQNRQVSTPSIVGTWRFSSPELVITATFNADGSYNIEAGASGSAPDSDAGTYTLQGNTINFKSNTEVPESGTWQLSNRNTLLIDIAGRSFTFQRVR